MKQSRRKAIETSPVVAGSLGSSWYHAGIRSSWLCFITNQGNDYLVIILPSSSLIAWVNTTSACKLWVWPSTFAPEMNIQACWDVLPLHHPCCPGMVQEGDELGWLCQEQWWSPGPAHGWAVPDSDEQGPCFTAKNPRGEKVDAAGLQLCAVNSSFCDIWPDTAALSLKKGTK